MVYTSTELLNALCRNNSPSVVLKSDEIIVAQSILGFLAAWIKCTPNRGSEAASEGVPFQ